MAEEENNEFENQVRTALAAREGGNRRGGHSPGRVVGAHKQYQIKYIWDNHQEIMRRLAVGEKPKTIARDLGITRQTVTNVARSNITRDRIDELHAAMNGEVIDIGKRIQALAPLALRVNEELMMSDEVSPAVRSSIAEDILDRSGYSPPKRISIEQRFGLTEEALQQVRERAKELGKKAGTVVEVEDAQFESIDNLALTGS